MKQKKKIDYEKQLIDSYNRWNYLYQYGGSDPFWPDGCNLNLVRNHILYYRRQLEEEQYFPEVYYWDVPAEVNNYFMARADEIPDNAARSLLVLKSDPNYQFLVSNGGQLSKEDAKAVCYGAVVGYVHNLEEWLSRLCQIKDGISEREFSDILVNLRRYENAAGYQESFARCRRKIETILQKRQNFIWNFVEEKNGQLCLF